MASELEPPISGGALLARVDGGARGRLTDCDGASLAGDYASPSVAGGKACGEVGGKASAATRRAIVVKLVAKQAWPRVATRCAMVVEPSPIEAVEMEIGCARRPRCPLK